MTRPFGIFALFPLPVQILPGLPCPSRKPKPAIICKVFSLYDDPSSIGLRCLRMPPVVSALLALVSSLLRSRWALQLQVLALQHQVAVYQQTVRRPHLSPTDRLFWSWLSWLWAGWQDVLAFVQPHTVMAWQRRRFRDYWRGLSQRGKPGRPAIAKEVRELIRKMWWASPTWGSPRIVDELRKLGIEVAKSTVEKYRVPLRKRPTPTWKTFLKHHLQDFMSLDFFIVPTV